MRTDWFEDKIMKTTDELVRELVDREAGCSNDTYNSPLDWGRFKGVMSTTVQPIDDLCINTIIRITLDS